MPSQHKHSPLRFRPPEAEREWLEREAARTGRPVNALLTEALVVARATARHAIFAVVCSAEGHGTGGKVIARGATAPEAVAARSGHCQQAAHNTLECQVLLQEAWDHLLETAKET